MSKRRWMVVAMILAAILSLGLTAQAQTTSTIDLSPVYLQPFDSHGLAGPALAGVSLSLHVLPASDNKVANWAAQHITLEIPCIGAQLDQVKAGLGAAINLSSKEGVSIKAGLAYLIEVKKPALMVGLAFPIR